MRLLALIGGLAIIGAVGVVIFFFGGFYSVAGTAEEPGIVNWALVNIRQASIARHADDQPPNSFNDPAAAPAGLALSPRAAARTAMGGPAWVGPSFRKDCSRTPPISRMS